MRRTTFLFFSVLVFGGTLGALTVDTASGLKPGDHVAIVGNSFADQMRKYGYFETTARLALPEYKLEFRNFGWAGDTLSSRFRPENFESEKESLTKFGTDVILICFGLGDALEGMGALDVFSENLNKLIASYLAEHYNGAGAPRLILVSPTVTEAFGIGHEEHQKQIETIAAYSRAMQTVARRNHLRFIDLFSPTRKLLDEGGGSPLTSNGVVLSPYGYWVVSRYLVDGLVEYRSVESMNGNSLQIGGSGSLNPRDVRAVGNTFQWSSANHKVSLPPPQGSRVHASLEYRRDRIVARQIHDGIYELKLNGQTLAKGTRDEWDKGFLVENSRLHQETEALRHAVVDKNAQFFYGWKSLNQVHIVGERRKSPSGRSLPEELVQFQALAESRESELKERFSALSGKESIWELKRDLN